MKIHHHPMSPNSRKVLLVAEELGMKYKIVMVDLLQGGSHTPEFLALNPNGKVPVLEDDGGVFWESNAILRYLGAKDAEARLYPADGVGRAHVDMWLDWQLTSFSPPIGRLVVEKIFKPMRGGQPNADAVAKATRDFNKVLGLLNRQLEGRDFVVGELSVADFALIGWMGTASTMQVDLSEAPNVLAWVQRMTERESWTATQPDS